MDFKNKYGRFALITGGTSGIGKEIAIQLAKKKMDLVLVARKEDELMKAKADLAHKYGVEVITISADISRDEGVEKVKQETLNLEIGIFVPAAGLEVNGAFVKNNEQSELQVLQLNVIATYQLARHYTEKMVARKKGGVLFVASLSGQMPNPYLANYAGSKAYIVNFAASIYAELKNKGVSISVLSPGLTKTPMIKDNGINWSKTPMTAMDPEEVAEIAVNNFGRKLMIVPGFKNKIMASMAKHSPLKMLTVMNEKMMRNAINPNKI